MIPSPSLKIFKFEDALRRIQFWREQSQRIVFTSGCFDILHIGHINFLEEAAGQGDKLVIGVNSDISANRLKAADRPINVAESRIYLLASLSFVDAVVAFDEDSADRLIEKFTPDVLFDEDHSNDDTAENSLSLKQFGGILDESE